MATAAFKSTTRRTSIGGDSTLNSNSNSTPIPSSSSNSSSSSARNHRRSRSVSRFSHRLPVEVAAEENPPSSIRRGKFVNTVRGSDFPEISLDDLAIEMFSLTSSPSEVSNTDCDGAASHRRGRSSAAVSDGDKTASHRRGRSVSRRGSRVSELRSSNNNNNNNSSDLNLNKNNKKNELGEKIGGFDNNNASIRRRRSLSVAPKSYSLACDSENELLKNRSRADSTRQNRLQKPISSNQRRGLQRSSSQKDLLRSYDGYSSYASTLTDDEGNNARYKSHGIEKGMRVASAIDKAPHINNHDPNSRWYKAGQKGNTHAGRDNRVDMKDHNKLSDLAASDARRAADSDVLKAVSTIRKNYKTKLEESEKRKEELLAEILLEEERGKELKKFVGDLLPNAKQSSPAKRHMRGRKRSTDRTRVSKHFVEEADKIIEDFISSVEETDISSFDGERSDTSSIVGGTVKPVMQYGDIESFRSPMRSDLQPGEMDGVVLPWLKWETGDAGSPLPGNDIKQHPATPKTVLQDALEEITGGADQERSVNSKSSRGSWSPGVVNSFCMDTGETSKTGEVESCKNLLLSRVPRRSRVGIDDYLKPPSSDNIVAETWRQRSRIHSGGLLICNGGSFGKFLV